jgi:hypothetical protein
MTAELTLELMMMVLAPLAANENSPAEKTDALVALLRPNTATPCCWPRH